MNASCRATLSIDEFIRRFLLHVLPLGFHLIRHTGLFANSRRNKNIALARELLAEQEDKSLIDTSSMDTDTVDPIGSGESIETHYKCPECGQTILSITGHCGMFYFFIRSSDIAAVGKIV